MRSVTGLSFTLGALGLMLASALPAVTSSAHAGGFTTTRFGGEGGHAATSDVSAIFYNPAGVSYGKGLRIYAEGLFAYRTVDYDRDPGAVDAASTIGSTPADGVAANSGKATLANGVISPFFGVTYSPIKNLGVGVSLTVPFGGQASWDKQDADANPNYPGSVDSSARWASIEGAQRALYYSLAAGWHTDDRKFAVGASVSLIQSEINLVRARNLDSTDHLVNDDGTIKEGRALLDVKSTDVGAAIGVMYQPTPCSRIGVSYHSQPGFGEQTLEGTLTTRLGTGAPGSIPIEVKQSLPDAIRVGGEWRAFEKAALHFAFDYQRWSLFKAQCIVNPNSPDGACDTNDDGELLDPASSAVNANLVRNWKDTFGLRVGGSYYPSANLEINAGLLYDSNAVPDNTLDPALIDMDKLIPQLGVKYTAGKLLISATLGDVIYFSRTTAPRTAVPAGKNRSPDMAGDYKQSVAYVLFGVGANL